MTRSVDTTSSSAPELSLPARKERRRLREAADLTHEQVAAAVGVTAATVRSWETGRTDPRGRNREAYAVFLAALAAPAAAPEQADTTSDGPAGTSFAADTPRTAQPAEPASAEAPAEPTAPAPPAESAAPAAPAVPAAPAALSAAGRTTGPAADFDALYDHAAPALARQTYLLTGRRTLALKAVERAFTRAWARWPEVATDPDPVGWVRAVAYDYALSPWHRFRRAHRRHDAPPADPADRILLAAVLSLPTRHRRTVMLYDGVGLDLPDTAAETEASTPTAGIRLVHAHADLADRIPQLAEVPPEKQSALLRDLFTALRPAAPLAPRPAAAVRGGGERRVRLWSRGALGLTAVIATATGYTAMTAPNHYEPPQAPGQSVSGVPPLSGPQQLTEQRRQLHEKLRADPEAGPARIAPKVE
ncbi:helix-turn-helix domain-containing protein [Streptomyces sp. NRRL F-2580]|uniref:helix-turn-helix domain-containing protein n=1 Tax=Streptomyces sp. NRRL F-2580 TaxID=1463841 RepID=UPI0004CAC9BD|nr:helix-turn-helix domain-containing protein [Streptomyces sp. NRRL F-2580]